MNKNKPNIEPEETHEEELNPNAGIEDFFNDAIEKLKERLGEIGKEIVDKTDPKH